MQFRNKATNEHVTATHAKEGVEGRDMDGTERRANLGDWDVTLADGGHVLIPSEDFLTDYEYLPGRD